MVRDPFISAYVPSYNNQATIKQAIESIRRQTYAVNELFVVDDASQDETVQTATAMNVRVVCNRKNRGRGWVRAQAMREAKGELVLCCDGGKTLSDDFVERCLAWLKQKDVAAVCGRVIQNGAVGVVDRWRGRHLFKMDETSGLCENGSFITAGAMVKRSLVLQIGNYNDNLRHTEDRELGERLISAGFKVIFDPALTSCSISKNNLFQVMERYWRWHAGTAAGAHRRNIESDRPGAASTASCSAPASAEWQAYWRQIAFSVKVMAWQDIKAGDPMAAVISLLSPHYQCFRSWLENRSVKNR